METITTAIFTYASIISALENYRMFSPLTHSGIKIIGVLTTESLRQMLFHILMLSFFNVNFQKTSLIIMQCY